MRWFLPILLISLTPVPAHAQEERGFFDRLFGTGGEAESYPQMNFRWGRHVAADQGR